MASLYICKYDMNTLNPLSDEDLSLINLKRSLIAFGIMPRLSGDYPPYIV